MRLGLIYPASDPTSPKQWSGIPHALTRGLESQGVDVVPIPYRLPWLVGRALAAASRVGGRRGHLAHSSSLQAFVRTKALRTEVEAAGPLDCVLALGTDMYDLPTVVRDDVPTATFDDGTFAMFMRHADSDIRQAGFPQHDVDRWIERQRRACRRANACLVSTAWAARSMNEDYGVPQQRVHVVGMGHRPRLVASDGRDWSPPRLLFVGVDWQRKNGAAVVDSFQQLRGLYPQATLDVVGSHPPLDLPGVTGHGLLRRDHLAEQERLDRLFERATMFVLPSLFDPSPIAYLEAASAGLPLIATSQGGAQELLGEASLVVDPWDGRALTEAMHQLADPKRARCRGAVASAMASRSTWQAVSGRIIESLEPTMDPRKAATRA